MRIRVARDAVHKCGCSQRRGQFPWQLKDQTYVPELTIRPQKEKIERVQREKRRRTNIFSWRLRRLKCHHPFSPTQHTNTHTHTHTHTHRCTQTRSLSPPHSESSLQIHLHKLKSKHCQVLDRYAHTLDRKYVKILIGTVGMIFLITMVIVKHICVRLMR